MQRKFKGGEDGYKPLSSFRQDENMESMTDIEMSRLTFKK